MPWYEGESPSVTDLEWVVVLDPEEIAEGRTELELNTGPIRVDQQGIDWGDAAIEAFMADQLWGSSAVDYRVPNRTVTIPMLLGGDGDQAGFDTARAALQQKVGLLQREGGILKRATTARTVYADIIGATLIAPDRFGATGAVEPGVNLVLECLPDFYGEEIVLDAVNATGVLAGELQFEGNPAQIWGDYPARCRIKVTDTSGNEQDGLIWGVRSRYHDPASTAALFYEAEDMTPLNGAAPAVRTGASGGSTMKLTGIPAQSGDLWVPMMVTDIGGSQLTHKGSYAVQARVFATDPGTQLRLVWGAGSLASPEPNQAVDIPGTDAFYIVDLGTIRVDETPLGPASWQGIFQVNDPDGDGTFEIDEVILQPLDEASGIESATTIASPGVIAGWSGTGTFADDASAGSLAWAEVFGGWETGVSSGVQNSHYLEFSDLGLAIPAGATILGIQAKVVRRAFGFAAVADAVVQLLKAGARVGSNKAHGTHWPSSDTADIYGGQKDLWGTTWAPADINDPGFGIDIQAVMGGAEVAHVTAIVMTVFYTLEAGFTVTDDVVIAATGQCEIRTEGAFRPDPVNGAWGEVSTQLGDLVRLPPSGLEGRPVEVLIKPSRGDLGSDATTSQDGGLDPFTMQVTYRPCYLLRAH